MVSEFQVCAPQDNDEIFAKTELGGFLFRT